MKYVYIIKTSECGIHSVISSKRKCGEALYRLCAEYGHAMSMDEESKFHAKGYVTIDTSGGTIVAEQFEVD